MLNATSKKLEPIDLPMARLLSSLFNDQNNVWNNGLSKASNQNNTHHVALFS